MRTATERPVRRAGMPYLISAISVSNLADGIGKTAFPLLAASMTRDPVVIGALSAVAVLPWLLFSIATGVLLDRVDRRRALALANLARAVVIGALAVVLVVGAQTIWLVFVAALLVGTAETVADSAGNVLIPSVAGRERLDRANGQVQAAEVVGQSFLGPLAGSLTFAVFAAFPFVLNSIGFALAAALLVGIAGSHRPARVPDPRRAEHGDVRDGLSWLRGSPLIVRLMAIAAALGLTSELAANQLVLYVLDDLRLSESMFGVFAAASGVGGLVGAGAPKLLRVMSRRAVLLGGMGVAGASFLGMGLTGSPVLAAVLFGAFAVGIVAVNVVIATARHIAVPDGLLGRVLGMWRTAVWGAIPAGALLGGVTTRLFGSASATFLLSGSLLLAVCVVAVPTLRRFGRDLVPDAGRPR
ncbi:MFS transporter [Actinophytocola sp.]|uniref:MFS transporter n=1 Tax=Actinophytocola sp. TaxID=1872138 RepID=UPI003D6C685B